MEAVQIQVYQAGYEEGVMALFRMLAPEFFHPEEEKDLRYYLRNELEDYYVVTGKAGTPLAAGGITYEPGEVGEACLSWDLVHPDYQGNGLGTQLVRHRLQRIREKKNRSKIRVRTSQLARGFYGRMGFVVQERVSNFWAPGYDLVNITMDL